MKPDCRSFEWDVSKEAQNIKKHHVDFIHAAEVFRDAHRVIIKDQKHSQSEQRYFCIGKVDRRYITTRFSYRKMKIRIIGAGYWRKGRKIYEEAKKEK